MLFMLYMYLSYIQMSHYVNKICVCKATSSYIGENTGALSVLDYIFLVLLLRGDLVHLKYFPAIV